MSNLENANTRIPVPSASPRTWDFFETTLVVLIADGVFTLTAEFSLAFMLGLYEGTRALSPEEFQALWVEGRWQGASITVAALPTIAVLWVAVRMAGRGFAEYLALNWPTGREVSRAFGIMALVVLAESFIAYLVGAQASATQFDLVVGGPGGLLILLIGGCIAGPVVEEFVVRGFMFRGWSESFLGPTGAIVLTSAIWAMNHTQYDWFGRLEIFGMGLALGHFRWRSGSTWLTVMVHSALNTFLFFMMGPYV
ncbi:MAG TPA: CPBP family intramembrane glutamic endopeptidase [Bradyrhizobium sp.]|nr:CPBP family intramembrane glutamic endopeptidase [Bradyrhizobium sp.]